MMRMIQSSVPSIQYSVRIANLNWPLRAGCDTGDVKTWSIGIGAVNGVVIRLHVSFLLLAFFVIAGSLEKDAGGLTRGVALVAIVFVSVLWHELGQLVVAMRLGRPPKAVMLIPISGVQIRDTREPDSKAEALDEIRIAAGGLVASLLAAAAAFAVSLLYFAPSELAALPFRPTTNLVKAAVWANLLIAGVNLLPAYPLIGGRMLRLFLAWPTRLEPQFHF